MSRPCESTCDKCGSSDISRRFYCVGDKVIQSPISTGKTSEFIHRGGVAPKVLKDCIAHHCRCCGYEWDTAPMEKDSEKSKKHCCCVEDHLMDQMIQGFKVVLRECPASDSEREQAEKALELFSNHFFGVCN